MGDFPDVAAAVFGTGQKALPEVRYAFSTLGATVWSVARTRMSERLDAPYLLHVDLVTDDVDADIDAMLGQSCIVDIERGEQRRSVHGVITQIDLTGIPEGYLQIRARIQPALALLDQCVSSRTYQEQTVPQILEVCESTLADYKRKVRYEFDQTYDERDYCIQFREPDLRFYQRLMQEEGMAFYFDHTDDEAKEVLVIVDDNRHFPDVAEEPFPLIEIRESMAEQESIQSLQSSVSLRPTAVMRRDFDYRVPKEPLDYEATAEDNLGLRREVYEHGERRFINDDGEALAMRRLQQIRMDEKILVGRSNVTGMSAGHMFEIEGHPRPELDGRYLIIEIAHLGDSSEVLLNTSAANRGADYRNEFRCIPADVPYRPALTVPRPRIYGDLTGTVCGPDKSEVHTDDEGRIKVAMHWDVDCPRNEDASCWIRVRHAWAGVGYGALILPRVGMEVVVSFLDGNPDRPLVTGCVYNGDNPPPLTLPDEKTKSIFRTSSSPGGKGFNELRIEDAAGSEEIYVHAQKDFNAKVKNSCSWSVGADRSVSVGGSESVTVKGNQTTHVDGQGGGDFSGAGVTVTGDYKLETTKTIRLEAVDSITLRVGDSCLTITPTDIALVAGKKSWARWNDKVHLESTDKSTFTMDPDVVVHSSKNANLNMTSDVELISSGEAKVQLTDNASIEGKQTDAVSTDGATMTLTADAQLLGTTTLVGVDGGGAALFEKAGATVAGKTTTIQGEAEVKIQGKIVNIG